MTSERKIAITGMGAVSSLGIGTEKMWENLINGVSSVAPVESFDTTGLVTRFAAEIKDFDPCDFIGKKDARRMDRSAQFSLAASKMAVEDAQLKIEDEVPEKIGVVIGSGIGGMSTFENQVKILIKDGPGKISPFFIPMVIPNMVSGLVSIHLGLRGPNFSVNSACATGSHSIITAANCIKCGYTDIMISGGTEAPICIMSLAGFGNMRALSTRNDDYEHASCPFDLNRDGFVVGEGSGVVILEELEHAKARGAHIYAILAGYGATSDAYHFTAPDPDGRGTGYAMASAVKCGGLELSDIDYINAHGTSTPVGDLAEVQSIKNLFGEHAKKMAISSTKSMMGHCLGAAGALETIVTALAVERDLVPPTINYRTPDPKCDLDFVPNVARKMTVNAALNNSFGFGGHNAVISLVKYKG